MSKRAWIHVFFFVLAVAVLYYLFSGAPTAAQSKDIAEAANGLGYRLFNYFTMVAAVGTIAFAIVELVKSVFDLRRYFNEWKLKQWMNLGWTEQSPAMSELYFLAIGDRERADALCGQPIEKMMAQIQAAANVALDFPGEYTDFYSFLTSTDVGGGSSPASRAVTPDQEKSGRDRNLWLDYATSRRAASSFGAAQPEAPDQEAARARIRLSNLVSRKLDGFQLRTEFYWDRLNQLAAMGASVAVMLYAVNLAGLGTLNGILLGLLSGAVAPFAKDMTSKFSQFARR